MGRIELFNLSGEVFRGGRAYEYHEIAAVMAEEVLHFFGDKQARGIIPSEFRAYRNKGYLLRVCKPIL